MSLATICRGPKVWTATIRHRERSIWVIFPEYGVSAVARTQSACSWGSNALVHEPSFKPLGPRESLGHSFCTRRRLAELVDIFAVNLKNRNLQSYCSISKHHQLTEPKLDS